MKNILWAGSAAAVLLWLIGSRGIAQDEAGREKSGKPTLVVAETNVIKATVEDVNPGKREVTLKDEEGNKVRMKVSKDVRNLDQVKKGDRVVAGYFQSAAITVNKPGESTAPSLEGEATIVSPKGDKPGGTAVQTTQVTATVEDINYQDRQMKLKDSEGNRVRIRVDERVRNLDEVKKGDQIVARFTEALAISVSKPEE